MDFDIDRLAKLSGIKSKKGDVVAESGDLFEESDLLNESASNRQLAEAKVREIIRKEIASIVAEMSGKEDGDTSWMYGKNKPTGSKKGQVSMGMFGIGFAK